VKNLSPKEHAANVAFARATVAGPDLLAAILPIARRIQTGNGTVTVTMSDTEAITLIEAVVKGMQDSVAAREFPVSK
jgi:hypothetical protein